MSKRQLLFVTYRDANLDEGMTYAIELAKAMNEDIVLFTVQRKDTLGRKFEDLMAGVVFAEAGEHGTARELVSPEPAAAPSAAAVADLVVKASKAGVRLSLENAEQDVVAGIRSHVKRNSLIDKVVRSPAVTESEVLTARDLNRLVRTASRPIVTMTRQSVQAGKDHRAEEKPPLRYAPTASY